MRKGILSNQKIMPYLFLLPFIVFFLLFRLWPILWSFILSFFSYDLNNVFNFVGLDNYIYLLKDPIFKKAVLNTLFYVVVYNLIMISMAMTIAMLLSSKQLIGRKFFRSVYFIPVTMSLPVVTMVFDLIFTPKGGFIAAVLQMFDQTLKFRLLHDIKLAPWGIIIMKLWRGTGYYTAYFLARMASISQDIYESARIDGSGPVKTFLKITIPLIKPTLLFVTVMSSILTFQTFEEPWIIAQGGPANATLTLQIYLYRTSFLSGKLGLGSAVAYFMTLLMMGFSIIYVKSLGRSDN